MKKNFFLFFSTLFFTCVLFANPSTITHLAVFGDSLSDHGSSKYGGFNRYSNGPVWPDIVSKSLCNGCLHDYAWGGAKSGDSNYNGFHWSGLRWQIEHYQSDTPLDKTLFIIWIGVNDLINGDGKSEVTANNIMNAIDKLASGGAKNIIVLNLPDFTLVPAYNNPNLADYKTFSPLKNQVRMSITNFNKLLSKLIINKNHDYEKNNKGIHLDLIDVSQLFSDLVDEHYFKNITDPWLGTYQYPDEHGYMWWDAWHPMTTVHKQIAELVMKNISDKYVFSKAC